MLNIRILKINKLYRITKDNANRSYTITQLFKFRFALAVVILLFLSISELSADILFDEIYINCDSTEFAYIYENYAQDIYINGSITYQNKTYDSVRIRIRGDDSRKFPRKSLKLKFDKEPFANGRTTLNLNADWLDKTLMHTYLSSRVFNDLGYPCFKAKHTKVILNGKFNGYYIAVENVDEEFLAAREMSLNCSLYKASRDGACLSLYDNLETLWEKKIGVMGNNDDLKELIKILNNTIDANFRDSLIKYFDYDKLLDILAINFLIQNRSTYYHNYYMYHNLETNKWLMLPWDLDKSSGCYSFWLRYADWGYPHTHANPLIERALANDSVFSDLQKRMTVISNQYYNEKVLFPLLDSLEIALEPIIHEDTLREPGTIEDYKEYFNYDRYHIKNCFNITMKQFKESPRNFHIGTKFFPEFGERIYFNWEKSRSPRNKEVKYTLSISHHWDHSREGSFQISNLKDTCFTLDSLLPEGIYYYQVISSDSQYIQYCYDHVNIMEVKRGNFLPCVINSKVTLTKEDSPYLINCPVSIGKDGELLVEPGVEIFILDTFKITSYGKINFLGSVDDSITFKIKPEITKSIKIELLENSISNFNYCNLEYISIFANKAQININYSSINDSDTSKYTEYILNTWYSKVYIDSSKLFGNGRNEGIIINHSDANIFNSFFYNIADAIEYIGVDNGKIINNTIFNAKDDAIDLNNGINCVISDNKIINAIDKGISIGNESENIFVRRNVIVGCNTGIAIKDSSSAIIENNTFHKNVNALNCYEKESGMGGALAIVRNCIFSNSLEHNYFYDSISSIQIDYSLANNELINGQGNIIGNPEFIDANKLKFKLQKTSICINRGDPNSELDPDGTRADIGAYYYSFLTPKIVINEINYNSSHEFDSGDWVEFYNNQNEDIDLSNWYFQDEDDSHKFVFKDGTILKAYTYFVLVDNEVNFKKIFQNTKNYMAGLGFGFSGSGELLRLYDSDHRLVDSVCYNDKEPWPIDGDGKGHSIELVNPNLDNNKGENWLASTFQGTPGDINSSYLNFNNAFPKDKSINYKIYPLPFFNEFYFIFDSIISENSDLVIFDILGKIILKENINKIPFKILKIDMQYFKTGVYFYSLRIGNSYFKGKLLKTN